MAKIVSRQQRLIGLDALRGVAILLVLGVHLPAYDAWAKIGWMGVDLFFVLSGFLISNLLLYEYRESGSINVGRFFVRRSLKIYPSFYCLCLATVAYKVVAGGFRKERLGEWFSWRHAFGELFFLQNYLGGIWGHTWTLAIEEHFYLLLPLCMVLMIRLDGAPKGNPFHVIPYAFLLVALGCLIGRILTVYHHPIYDHRLYFQQSHLRIDSLLFGVALSYGHHFKPRLMRSITGQWRMLVFLLGIAALLPCILIETINPLTYTIGFTLNYLGFGSVILLTVYREDENIAPGPGQRAIAWIGFYSYSIYLWHTAIAMVFVALDARLKVRISGYVIHAIYLFTCLVVGCGLSKLIEVPALRLRDRLAPSTRAAS